MSDQSERKDDGQVPFGGFQWDRHINVGHVLTTLAMAGSIVFWGNAMDKRVAVLEEQYRTQQQRDAQQDNATATALLLLRSDFADMRGETRELNRRIERYIEARSK
ncbi:MAG: hypothetical protein ACOYKQ_07965 [Polymorphobacter sp.]